MRPLTCSRCGQEVRWGWRDGSQSWLHRGPVDHATILGNIDVDLEHVEHERHKLRERPVKINPEGFPLLYEIEEYSAASVEQKLMEKDVRGRARLAEDADPDAEEDESAELEPVECRSTPLNHKGSTEVVMLDGSVRQVETPGGVRILLNLAAKLGWDVVRLTYSRGPYLGARGSLGVSDSIVLVVRGPMLDGAPVYAVASWRDAKSTWAWRVVNRSPQPVGARALAAWMKEVPSGPSS